MFRLETHGAETHLFQRFFPGGVENAAVMLCEGCRRLGQKGTFADARLTAEKDHRSHHDAAAEDQIQLRVEQGVAFAFGEIHITHGFGLTVGHR